MTCRRILPHHLHSTTRYNTIYLLPSLHAQTRSRLDCHLAHSTPGATGKRKGQTRVRTWKWMWVQARCLTGVSSTTVCIGKLLSRVSEMGMPGRARAHGSEGALARGHAVRPHLPHTSRVASVSWRHSHAGARGCDQSADRQMAEDETHTSKSKEHTCRRAGGEAGNLPEK